MKETFCNPPPRKNVMLDGVLVSLLAVTERDENEVPGATKNGGRLKYAGFDIKITN